MGDAGDLLDEARRSLGLTEPNHIQDWYARRNGSAYNYNFAWCDAAISYWAYKSGNHDAVCPAGDRAYTVYHARDFQKRGQWRSGTVANLNRARAGDIVFFDWGASNSIGYIDHIGVVERVLGGGRVQTIEGNTSDRCLRRIRSAGTIAGYGRPNYDGISGGSSSSASGWMEDMVRNLPLLKSGEDGEHVQTLQGLLRARSHPEVEIDGDFGSTTETAVKAVQSWGGVAADGEVGPKTWPVLLRVH